LSATGRFEGLVHGGGRLRFRTLDVEGELVSQGLGGERERYGVVIAVDVLHATRGLGATVRNVRRLLREGQSWCCFGMMDLESARNTFCVWHVPEVAVGRRGCRLLGARDVRSLRARQDERDVKAVIVVDDGQTLKFASFPAAAPFETYHLQRKKRIWLARW
jgi:hypothetical protein